MKPFDFEDFSGGITDKTIPGEKNRYTTANNLLIDHDKKLVMSDGFDIYASTAYQFAAVERVARLVNFDLDNELLGFQNKAAFRQATYVAGAPTGAWTEITGPGGGSATTKAFNTNSASSLVETDQWQRHLYAVSDSGDPPIKLYRDWGGTMRLRSAGLPEFTQGFTTTNGVSVETMTPSDGGLALAITLANDLRTQMIAHYGSNGATAGTVETVIGKAHITHADLTSQASAVSASTVASDLPTLITLLNVLRAQYTLHMVDAQIQEDPIDTRVATAFKRNYHVKPASAGLYYQLHSTSGIFQPAYYWTHFLNLSVEDQDLSISSSTVIADVIVYLNDLREKWNWHQYATLTHFNAWRYQGTESYTHLGSYATAVARVEPYTWAKIVPNYGAFIQYVKDIKTEFDYHRTGGMHYASDTITAIPSGYTTPTTVYEAISMLGVLAQMIFLHVFDTSGTPYSSMIEADISSGSPSLQSVDPSPTDNTLIGYRVIPLLGTGSTPFTWNTDFTALTRGSSYLVTANSSAGLTITCASNFTATYTSPGRMFVLSGNFYHTGSHSSAYINTYDPFDQHWTMNEVDYRFTSAASLQAIADFAYSLMALLKAHSLDRQTAVPETFTTAAAYEPLYGRRYQRYGVTDNTDASGNIITPHIPISGKSYIFFPVSAANNSGFAADRFDTANTPEAASFNYKALFRYDYTIGTKSFTDRGAPSTAIQVIGFINEDSGGATEVGKFAASLTNIYSFANAANENWDTADTTNFKKEIYRTIGNGQLYFRVDADGVGGSISNATTSLSDYTSDTYIASKLALYTNDGSPENNRPPAASGIHIFNNTAYYTLGNRVYQSVPKDPDSVPGDFFEEFEENIVGVSSTRSVAVAFGSSKVYRLIGGFDQLGRGALLHERISDRTGCISAQSIVKADNGIFFAGKDGFYFTDGYQCMRVTDLEDTFRGYTDTAAKRARIQGAYDNISKRVYWTVQTGSGSNPDKIWVMDLQFGIKPDATPITTISCPTAFNPTALAFYGGIIHYGDGDGYCFKQTRGLNINLVKDTAVAATSWAAQTVIWDFKSCHDNFGSSVIRKYATRVTTQFEQQSTNLSVQIYSDADKGRIISTLPIIRSRKLTDWGDSKIDWMASVYTQRAGNVIDEFRMLKGDGSLRSNYRAFEFTNAYCVILNSTDLGTITIANVAGTVYTATLTSLVATRKWPLYSVGYYLKISSVEYPVTVRTSDSVIRFDSTGLTSPTVGVPASFELWGYPKNERARLIAYSVNVDAAGDNETSSKGPVTTGGQNSA